MALAEALAGDVLSAARALLGRRLRSDVGGSSCEIVLTEVEAYGGGEDEASHARSGHTLRNRSMFGPAGTIYVYRAYGLHWCANVVTGPEGLPAAVLLRGGVPHSGLERMVERRGRPDHLADGPGKLCQALGIDGTFDGTSALSDGPLGIVGDPVGGRVEATPRIGISRAVDRLWRFVLLPD